MILYFVPVGTQNSVSPIKMPVKNHTIIPSLKHLLNGQHLQVISAKEEYPARLTNRHLILVIVFC